MKNHESIVNRLRIRMMNQMWVESILNRSGYQRNCTIQRWAESILNRSANQNSNQRAFESILNRSANQSSNQRAIESILNRSAIRAEPEARWIDSQSIGARQICCFKWRFDLSPWSLLNDSIPTLLSSSYLHFAKCLDHFSPLLLLPNVALPLSLHFCPNPSSLSLSYLPHLLPSPSHILVCWSLKPKDHRSTSYWRIQASSSWSSS